MGGGAGLKTTGLSSLCLGVTREECIHPCPALCTVLEIFFLKEL